MSALPGEVPVYVGVRVFSKLPLAGVTDTGVAVTGCALVTVMVYVFVVPSCAVTSTGILFTPTLKATAVALPLVTVLPLILMVALAWFLVAVTLIDAVALLTLAV